MIDLLITGAASGIGYATAVKLAERGARVFGVDKNMPSFEGLSPEVRERLEGFRADVTSEEELSAVKGELESRGTVLDAIVCVAGIHTMASLAESDPEEMKRLIDVNLWGTMLTVRCLHSLLSGQGRVVIVSSEVAAYDPMPFNGLYNVSKTALDCYAQALRQELGLIGQRVVTVRPGAVLTPLARGSEDSTARLAAETELYKRQARHFSSLVKKFTGTPMAPEIFAGTVVKATLSRRPRLVYAKNRNPGLILLSLLPKRLQCSIIRWLLNRR